MTWDRALMYARGHALGEEFRGKGINVALGPVVSKSAAVNGTGADRHRLARSDAIPMADATGRASRPTRC